MRTHRRPASRTRLLLGGVAVFLLLLIGLSFVLSNRARATAEDQAQERAERYVTSALAREVSAQDVSQGLVGPDYRTLLIAVQEDILSDPRVTAVRVWTTDGDLVFSTASRDAVGGATSTSESLLAAAEGATTSLQTEAASGAGATPPATLLTTYAPLRSTDAVPPVAVAQIDQRYESIESEANRIWRPVQVVSIIALGGVAILLGLSLGPTAVLEPEAAAAAGVPVSDRRSERKLQDARERAAAAERAAREVESRLADAERRLKAASKSSVPPKAQERLDRLEHELKAANAERNQLATETKRLRSEKESQLKDLEGLLLRVEEAGSALASANADVAAREATAKEVEKAHAAETKRLEERTAALAAEFQEHRAAAARQLDELAAAAVGERDELLARVAAVEAERDVARGDRETISRERDAILADLETMTRDRDAVRSDLGALASERDAIVGERDGLLTELNALREDRDAKTQERDAVRAALAAATQERDVLAAERDASRSERGEVVGERDALRAEREAAFSQRDAARAERDSAVGERDEARALRDAAVRERDEIAARLEEAADRGEGLGDAEERDRLLDEARMEIERLRTDLEGSRSEFERLRRELDRMGAEMGRATAERQAAMAAASDGDAGGLVEQLERRLEEAESRHRTELDEVESRRRAEIEELQRAQASLANTQFELIQANRKLKAAEDRVRELERGAPVPVGVGSGGTEEGGFEGSLELTSFAARISSLRQEIAAHVEEISGVPAGANGGDEPEEEALSLRERLARAAAARHRTSGTP